MTKKLDEFASKIDRLQRQLTIAKVSDYSYPDAHAALDLLSTRLKKVRTQLDETDDLSEAIRFGVYRQANWTVLNFSLLIGMIVRSASVRNAFELYSPFLSLCHSLVDDDAKLILSSEWQFVPFTYPQNLDVLPNFIFIGLPASESDNIFIFPAAAHELGHSVWLKHSVAARFESKLKSLVNEYFRKNVSTFYSVFQEHKNADIEQDMFVSSLKAQTAGFASKQLEELFCDFIGLLIFKESYLYAFEYLVAPTLSGMRTFEYPDTKRRAEILEKVSREKLNSSYDGYSSRFASDSKFGEPKFHFLCEAADVLVEALVSEIFDEAQVIVQKSKIARPSVQNTGEVMKAFSQGVPFDGAATLGDMVNAALKIYLGGNGEMFEKQGQQTVDYLTDLVLKSAEIHEIKRIMT